METYRVALIHNIIAPYRIPLFEKLSSHPNINLVTYFCAKTHNERKWDVLSSKMYNHEVLNGITLDFSGVIYHINPSIVVKLFKGKYDVVIIGGSSDFTTQIAFIFSNFLRVPVILWSENIGNSQSFFSNIMTPLTKYVLKNADGLIVPGSKALDFHIKMGANPNNIFIAPNSVDNNFFMTKCSELEIKKLKIETEFNIHGKKIILFVGQLIERKGIIYLLHAYKRLKNEVCETCLIIVGDGYLKSNLIEICFKESIDDVHFTGWVSEDQKISFYSIADIFVLPTMYDVWGLVINEAMACGLPIITTNEAGASEMVVSGENGFVVDKANVDQLYFAMKNIILNEKLLIKMKQHSLEIINQKYNFDNMTNGFISAILHTRNR
ncbi:glycosyltransferase family 4 protein [Methanosarcina mazei]|uniref:Glycosyl transferase family 1 domain-containing protein n=1 Tax=Methanosarcina mazei TaxID=2209 RepID=A0A0F8SN92_METMZ|nr:glycosyltransferase family 4 protein [Methanosarcina mazei]KKH68191.1 hypothetical protein DU87_06075 [Methanosarcina mazei]